MAKWGFTKGLHDTGNGMYAYIQPDGSWGWSNAGLVESCGETLLVDTLMGLDITRDMLEEMRRKVPASKTIDKLVITHSNADHFLGNELVVGAEIIGTVQTAKDMKATDLGRIERLFSHPGEAGEAGEFIYEVMGSKFDVSGVTLTPPTRTFEKALELTVGDKPVKLIDLGPCHTKSDVIVYAPGDKTLFTGDLLFAGGTPIMWAGPTANWIAACEYMLALDVETIVPGHGPICDKSNVREQKAYFEYLRNEARVRYDAGVDWEEAARDISLGEFSKLSDGERICANIYTMYKEFGAVIELSSEREVYATMSRWKKRHEAEHGHDHAHP
jgi:cyclase